MSPVKRDDRLQAILDLLNENERVQVDALSNHFNVSPETIRRDLSTLSEQNLLRKVHGGAVRFQTAQEHSFTLRTNLYLAQKTRIAQQAVQFVDAGDSLFISAGTTMAVFARELAKTHERLTILTNSALIANELWNRGQSEHRIILLGGLYYGGDSALMGEMTLAQIRQFHADHSFVSCGTVSAEQGIMEYSIEAASIVHAMQQYSRRTTVLADSSKLDKSALVNACALSQVTRLITDAAPSADLQAALEAAQTDLLLA